MTLEERMDELKDKVVEFKQKKASSKLNELKKTVRKTKLSTVKK